MLILEIPEQELYNQRTEEFINIKSRTLKLEHSLVSLSKWESKWKVPFLHRDEKTDEQTIDYIRMMTITQNVPDYVYSTLPDSAINHIYEYIGDSQSATTFSDMNNRPGSRIITAEIIYYWMVAFNIPMECQKWHLNRLLTLIKVCSIESGPKKKMPRKALLNRQRMLNEQRKAQYNTTG